MISLRGKIEKIPGAGMQSNEERTDDFNLMLKQITKFILINLIT